MGLCVDSTTLTFNGVRADDGGQPEELTLGITKFCIDPSPAFGSFVATFDARLDTTFLFSPPSDGSYQVVYTGGVTGIIETDNVLVKFRANNNIGALAKADSNKLLCNECLSDEYMLKKALIAMADNIFDCERLCEAEQFLLDIVNDDCGTKIGDCGCS